jgi:hypothetical protein
MRNSRNDERSPLKMAILMVGGLVGAYSQFLEKGRATIKEVFG